MREGIFKVSLQSLQKGAILPTPSFSNFVHPPLPPPLPCHLQPLPPPLFTLLSCFFGWMGDHTTFDVSFYLLIICIYTCRALVSYCQTNLDVCFMQQGVKFTEVWHKMWFLLVLWFCYHTHKNAAHSWVIRLTHPYKYVFTPPVMCSQQLPLLH